MPVVGALWGLPTQQQNLHRLTATDAKLWAINTKPKLQQSGEFRMPAIDIGQLDLTSEVLPQTVEMPYTRLHDDRGGSFSQFAPHSRNCSTNFGEA